MLLAMETIDILDKVHGFYQDAWTNLLWFVGVLMTVLALVVGVLVPWWLERSRKQTFQLSEERVMDEIAKSREQYEQGLEEAKAKIRAVAEEAKREMYASVGQTFFSQLVALVNKLEMNVELVVWIWGEAIGAAIAAGVDHGRFSGPMALIERYFQKDKTRVRRAAESKDAMSILIDRFKDLRRIDLPPNVSQHVDKMVKYFEDEGKPITV